MGRVIVMASHAPCRQYLQKLFCWETKTRTRVDPSILGKRVSLASRIVVPFDGSSRRLAAQRGANLVLVAIIGRGHVPLDPPGLFIL